jgi:LAS superfamily LD-carboxypeptidase LdcB
MKEFINKRNIGGDLIIILVMGVCLFGVFKYFEYKLRIVEDKIQKSNIEGIATKSELEAKIKALEDAVLGTGSNLNTVLEQEKQKSDSLLQQFSEISNTVGALSKLSSTDPELLKKYSKIYFLNEHYIPVSLSRIDDIYLSGKSSNFEINTGALGHLQDMINAGNTDGVSILVQSAYRSFQTQANLKTNYKITYGTTAANRFSADQGYSEHQLGTAVDFTTSSTAPVLVGFSKTPEFKWMGQNAYKYGFILSYPDGNKYYKYEPWHWRYVGVELATKLHDENMYFYDMDQRQIDSYLAKIFV